MVVDHWAAGSKLVTLQRDPQQGAFLSWKTPLLHDVFKASQTHKSKWESSRVRLKKVDRTFSTTHPAHEPWSKHGMLWFFWARVISLSLIPCNYIYIYICAKSSPIETGYFSRYDHPIILYVSTILDLHPPVAMEHPPFSSGIFHWQV